MYGVSEGFQGRRRESSDDNFRRLGFAFLALLLLLVLCRVQWISFLVGVFCRFLFAFWLAWAVNPWNRIPPEYHI